jgi:hypothetical protein
LEKGVRDQIYPENANKKGIRKAAISRPLDISKLRQELKSQKVSLNDYIICAANLALSRICTDSDWIKVSIPFTLKDYPKSLETL